jgi:outer membrane protein TolC
MADDKQPDPMLLTEAERFGVLNLRSSVLTSKAELCDAQHALQQAQDRVEAAQRGLAMAQQTLSGAVIQMGYSRGLTGGSVDLSPDGLRIVKG